MGWKSTTAFLTLTFFGLGSLVYLLLKHNEEDEDFFRPHISKTHIRRVKVPIECIGIVIGHCGNTIKEIEAKSDAKIQIIEDCNTSEDYKICVIKGKPEATQFAESLIHEIIVNQALIETYEMYVPSEACGRIIGKNGDNIRLISRNSNAKIMVSNLPVSPNSLEKKIIIKGTSEQIALAKLLVEQKIEEYLEFRNKMETQVSSRAPRNKQKYLLPAKGESKNVDNHPQKQKFVATSSNGLIEVYVCAIETPDKFWLQMVGPSTVELDKLIEQMTDYYTKDENQERHKLREVKNGQVVAAPFPYDNKWYRAEIQEIVKGSEESDIVLYYVDYGDSSKCKESTVYELRTDFLRLRFQAIECMLAKVKPRESSWTNQARDVLCDLTHVAMWKSLMAKIHTYRDRPSGLKREGSPIPCVELFDIQGESTVDVAEELVQRGFALWDHQADSSVLEKKAEFNKTKNS